jgi:hypothetical protein
MKLQVHALQLLILLYVVVMPLSKPPLSHCASDTVTVPSQHPARFRYPSSPCRNYSPAFFAVSELAFSYVEELPLLP